jgi:hypothetical protein
MRNDDGYRKIVPRLERIRKLMKLAPGMPPLVLVRSFDRPLVVQKR